MLGQFTASVTYNERVKCRSERGSFGRRGGEEYDKATRPIVRAACRPMLRRARIVTSTYPRGTHPRREGRLLLSPSPSPLTSPRSPVAAEKGLPHSSVGAQFGGLRRGIDLHPPAHLPGRVLRDLARPPAAISLPLSLPSSFPPPFLSFLAIPRNLSACAYDFPFEGNRPRNRQFWIVVRESFLGGGIGSFPFSWRIDGIERKSGRLSRRSSELKEVR